MGARSYDNDTTISTVTDNRLGVAAEAEGSIAAGGSVAVTSTVSNVVNNTTVESDVAKTALKTIGDSFTDNQKGLQSVVDFARDLIGEARGITKDAFSNSAENLRAATALSADSVKSIERVSLDNLASTERNLRTALQYSGDMADNYFSAGQDLNKLVQTSGREFLAGAQTLVKDVLTASQSEDAKNYQATLGALVKIALVVGAALTVPYLFKGAR